MKSKLLFLALMISFGSSITVRLSLAEDMAKEATAAIKETAAPEVTAPSVEAQPEQVDNKICPISGEKIEAGSMGAIKEVTYNGKVYKLCCAMCEKDFMKDPEAAIEKIESMAAQEQMNLEKK